MSEEYGEIKVKKNIFPNDAKKIVEKGTIKILVTQNLVSSKTKKILTEGEVTLYEGVEPNEVNKISIILGNIPYPIQSTKSGAIATVGIVCVITRTG